MTPQAPLHWVVDRFENGVAVLVCRGKELQVPKVQLPKNTKEGDVIAADFYLAKDERARRENIARALLEEILGKE